LRPTLILLALPWVASALAAGSRVPPNATDARAIMQAVDDRDPGDRMLSDAQMVITDSGGRVRTLSFKTAFLENRTSGKRVNRKRLSQFTGPADVRSTGLLTIDYEDPATDDPQWVYLPRMRKSKRIAGADKANSWMGSDFTYSDLARQDPKDYDFALLKEAVNVGGEVCWLIEGKPRTARAKDDTGYLKIEYWISKEKLLPVQAKAFVKKGQKIKLFKFEDIRLVDGIWVPQKYAARTLSGSKVESTTVVTMQNVKIKAAKVGDADFTVAHLEQGL